MHWLDEKLTKNFTYRELFKSPLAIRRGIDNVSCDEVVLINLKRLTEKILQPVREHFRKPVHCNSGYRCDILNRLLKSEKTSQHRKGEAADIEIAYVDNYKLARYIMEYLEFDELILEYHIKGKPRSGWVHVSFRAGRNRHQVLTKLYNQDGFVKGLVE